MEAEKDEECLNYFRLVCLLNHVCNVLRDYFKSRWPIVYERANPGSVIQPWTDKPSDAAEFCKVDTTLRLKAEEKKKFDTGNTNEWDFSLLTSVLRYSSLGFVLPSSPELIALDDLKAIRNKYIGHPCDIRIPYPEFNMAWQKTTYSLELFNTTQYDLKTDMTEAMENHFVNHTLDEGYLQLPGQILMQILTEQQQQTEMKLSAVKDVPASRHVAITRHGCPVGFNQSNFKNRLSFISLMLMSEEDVNRFIKDTNSNRLKLYHDKSASNFQEVAIRLSSKDLPLNNSNKCLALVMIPYKETLNTLSNTDKYQILVFHVPPQKNTTWHALIYDKLANKLNCALNLMKNALNILKETMDILKLLLLRMKKYCFLKRNVRIKKCIKKLYIKISKCFIKIFQSNDVLTKKLDRNKKTEKAIVDVLRAHNEVQVKLEMANECMDKASQQINLAMESLPIKQTVCDVSTIDSLVDKAENVRSASVSFKKELQRFKLIYS